MTNAQAVKALIAFPVQPEVIAKALTDSELDADGVYTVANKQAVNTVAIEVLRYVQQVSSFSEGDLSYSVSNDTIEGIIAGLTGENNRPKIRNRSYLW